MPSKIKIDYDRIVSFCHHWQVVEFALFGSVLTDTFNAQSDVDVLVSFVEQAQWSLYDLVAMQDELQELFDRTVHLVEEAGLRNPFRRHSILASREIIYAA